MSDLNSVGESYAFAERQEIKELDRILGKCNPKERNNLISAVKDTLEENSKAFRTRGWSGNDWEYAHDTLRLTDKDEEKAVLMAILEENSRAFRSRGLAGTENAYTSDLVEYLDEMYGQPENLLYRFLSSVYMRISGFRCGFSFMRKSQKTKTFK